MSEIEIINSDYIGYEYKSVTVSVQLASMYLDGYESFGWSSDKNIVPPKTGENITLHLKRDRKILNKMELTRLQRNFEACMFEIETLEKSKTNKGTIPSIMVGLIGTAFMAGSTFAITATPPIIWLCILLAIPGFVGWIIPTFINKTVNNRRVKVVSPLIEKKCDEIHELCKKGRNLL